MGSILTHADAAAYPQHVAIIMDGNGRWADAIENSNAPKRLFVSVTATAGIECVRQSPTNPSTLIAPSEREYAVWTRKWIKPGSFIQL